MEVEQRCVIRFLMLEGCRAEQIHDRLVRVYAEDAFVQSTVYKWMREFRSGRKAVEDLPRVGRPCLDDIDGAILQKLNKYPFHSCRSRAEDVGVAPSTIWKHLTESLGFASRCLHWVPHELTDDLREKRIAIGRQLLEILEEAQSSDFRGLVTGDESWFHLSYAPRAVWTISRDEVPTKEKQAISTRKFMLTVFWSVDGFHVAEFLPTGTRFDTAYFAEHIIPSLATKLRMGASERRGVVHRLHCDNASPHNSARSQASIRDYGFHRIPQPPYSPDLAPSDFYLFGTVKRQLENRELVAPEDLLRAILQILARIPREELMDVFNAWIERVRWVIANNGSYFG